MNFRSAVAGVAVAALAVIGGEARAAIIETLDATNACSVSGTLSVSDVTGDNGGATNCWGPLPGNDPADQGGTVNGYEMGGMFFAFVSKFESEGTKGADVGLGANLASLGSWFFDAGAVTGDFLLSFKFGNEHGVWSFEGDPDNTSFEGTFDLPKDLSHISLYRKQQVPNPGAFALLGLGLAFAGLRRIRRR